MTSKNQEWWERAKKVTPGAQSNLKARLYSPIFIERGKGAHLWDVDGKEYIDYFGGHGPGIFGHSNQEYIQALKDQLDKIYYLATLAAQHPMEVELAEKFVQHVPCSEKVRFCITGTEAVQLAIRLARAFKKRRYFIRFEGHYHGWLDNVLGGLVNDNPTDMPFPLDSPQDGSGTEGREPNAFSQSFLLPWNDIGILETVLKKYGEQVFMVLMEPVNCNGGGCPPRPGYLKKVRELCDKYGILLCFDEVITGFRVGLSGSQGEFGVTPDLATFGKAQAGGIAISAVAGKGEILDQLFDRRVVGAGTFNGNPLSLAASLVTLRILERGEWFKKIDHIQNRLVNGLQEISKRRGVPMLVQGPRGIFNFHFIDKPIAYSVRDLRGADATRMSKFVAMLAEDGILVGGNRPTLNDAITDADIDKTLESAERAVARL